VQTFPIFLYREQYEHPLTGKISMGSLPYQTLRAPESKA